jgi:anti-anti-sigma factor
VGIKRDEYDGVGILAPEGDFAGSQVGPARQAVDGWLRAGTARVVFDLSRMTFIDSEGLQVMTWAAARCQPLGGKAVLAGADANCRKILEMTRLDRRLESYPDAAAAMKALADGR